MSIDQFIARLTTVIVNPALKLLFAVALFYFVLGLFQYLRDATNETSRTTGRDHIMWGLIGMAIMAGVFGIIEIATNTFLRI